MLHFKLTSIYLIPTINIRREKLSRPILKISLQRQTVHRKIKFFQQVFLQISDRKWKNSQTSYLIFIMSNIQHQTYSTRNSTLFRHLPCTSIIPRYPLEKTIGQRPNLLTNMYLTRFCTVFVIQT